MKRIFTFLIAASISQIGFAQLPYNPDANDDGIITASDLTSFLSVFGNLFPSDGVVSIDNGGTGGISVEEAKTNLEISYFTDSLLLVGGMEEPYGYVNAGLRVIGNVAEGEGTIAEGQNAHAEGFSTFASGDFSHAQNRFTEASGTCSHAEGEACEASGVTSHAEGFSTTASGISAHSEGSQTNATGFYSHAQNRLTNAAGTCSHAEGENTTALGIASHSEGLGTSAQANRSHAGGLFTIADQVEQTAIGRYNLTGQTGALLSVGNGTSTSNRSDAFRVMNNGNTMVAGTLTVGSGLVVNGEDLVALLLALQEQNTLMAAQIEELQMQVEALMQGAAGPSNE